MPIGQTFEKRIFEMNDNKPWATPLAEMLTDEWATQLLYRVTEDCINDVIESIETDIYRARCAKFGIDLIDQRKQINNDILDHIAEYKLASKERRFRMILDERSILAAEDDLLSYREGKISEKKILQKLCEIRTEIYNEMHMELMKYGQTIN
jgi:hypothetical protein